MNNMNLFGGTPVITNDMLSEYMTFSNRKLKKKRWHSRRNYAKRVQKKWDARFGVKSERYILKTDRGLVMHPNTLKALQLNTME